MAAIWKKYNWVAATIMGSAIFALGFSLFLSPNDMNPGGISGLAQVLVELLAKLPAYDMQINPVQEM